ncbi:STAS-like domain-containing protein [uncultured Streptococcus sp.]|uniref:STAS-like domain-containing protein n=1 Tax=uncultured Streptococcus sp. TaxID=83427 RepID=UPI0028D5AA96|nr:DUF4325 domain-containing protein [uncultured Streptococcus sp.]
MEIVNVKEVIGSKLATSSDKGLLLYTILVEKVSNREPVTVDFSDIKTVIPSFTNKAFGKLFDVINLTEYKDLIRYNEDINELFMDCINYSIENSTTKREQYKAEMNKMYQEIEEQNA